MQAVNTGKEVVTHTDLVSVPGYTGAGYVILDPITGEGAYKISGGGNGSWSDLKESLSLLWSAIIDAVISVAEMASEMVKTLSFINKLKDYFGMIEGYAATCSDLTAFYAVLMYTTFLMALSVLLGALLSTAGGVFVFAIVSTIMLSTAVSQFKVPDRGSVNPPPSGGEQFRGQYTY